MNLITTAFEVLEEIQFYTEELNKYKTVSSKKAFVTRSANKQRIWVNDLKEAVNEHNGLLFGSKYTKLDVTKEQLVLEGIKQLYNVIK